MKVKDILHEDFVNYKSPSMFIVFPSCTFKCERESGVRCCQNSGLANEKNKELNPDDIAAAYASNPITKAVVFGGLEPFDSYNDMLFLIHAIRLRTKDPIVIYTGYNREEISFRLDALRAYKNIIVKFGRYIPGEQPHYDDVLGVNLASDNQYAERIS